MFRRTRIRIVIALLFSAPPSALAQHEEPWFGRADEDIPRIIDAMEEGDLVLLWQGDEQIAPRSFTPEVGDTTTFVIDIDKEAHAWLDDARRPSVVLPSCRLRVDTKVTKVEPDGNYVLQARFADAELMPRAIGTPERRREVQVALNSLEAMTHVVTLTPSGEVVDSSWFPPRIANATIRELISSLSHHIRGTRLPTEPIGLGAVWRTRSPSESVALQYSEMMTHTLSNITEDGLVIYSELRGVMPEQTSPVSLGPEGSSTLRPSYAVGGITTVVDPKTGAPVAALFNVDVVQTHACTTPDRNFVITSQATAARNIYEFDPHMLTVEEAQRIAKGLKPGEVRLIEPGENPKPLAYAPREGELATWMFSQSTDAFQLLPTGVPNDEVTLEFPTYAVFTSVVKEVLPSGVFVVEDTIDEFRYLPFSDEDAEAIRQNNEAVRPIEGARITYTYAPDGEVLNVSTDPLDTVDPAVRPMLEEMCNVEASDFFKLPHRPIGVGAVWRTATEEVVENIRRTVVETTTLTGFDDRYIYLYSDIIIIMPEQPYTNEYMPEGTEARILHAAGEGYTNSVVDRFTGQTVSHDGETNVGMDVEVTAAGITGRVLQIATAYETIETVELIDNQAEPDG